LRYGEILALLGDNGAGKSTLIGAISGIVSLDEGEFLLNDRPVRLGTAAQARSQGIETVFQDLAVFDELDVTANFLTVREEPRPAWLDPLGFLSARREAAQWHTQARDMSVESVSARHRSG
jgi:D-xylose transport system ATP-binding protein